MTGSLPPERIIMTSQASDATAANTATTSPGPCAAMPGGITTSPSHTAASPASRSSRRARCQRPSGPDVVAINIGWSFTATRRRAAGYEPATAGLRGKAVRATTAPRRAG